MKKLTAVLLALLIALGTLTGCKQEPVKGEVNEKETNQQIDGGKETQQHNPTKDDTDPVETFPPTEDFIKDYDQDDSKQGFSIKGKRYSYKGCVMERLARKVYPAGEMLLLNVTNQTDTNYSATLTVTYLDENGEKIKTEKQTFKQFAAGYQKYFLFNPQKSYASYTCELSLTEYTGEILANKISCAGINRVFEDKDYIWNFYFDNNDNQKYPTITAQIKMELLPHPEFRYSKLFIIFDNTGEIYMIQKQGNEKVYAATEPGDDYHTVNLYQTTEKKLVWPEELKGELKAIVIFDILE